MAAQRTTFAKIQRERARQAKQEAKRAAKLGQEPVRNDDDRSPSDRKADFLLRGSGSLNPNQLLEAVELLTAQHAAGILDDDEVEEIRQDVIRRAS